MDAKVDMFTVQHTDRSGMSHARDYYQATLTGRGSKPGIGKTPEDAIEDALRNYVAMFDHVVTCW